MLLECDEGSETTWAGISIVKGRTRRRSSVVIRFFFFFFFSGRRATWRSAESGDAKFLSCLRDGASGRRMELDGLIDGVIGERINAQSLAS